jgi:hypothetical protein
MDCVEYRCVVASYLELRLACEHLAPLSVMTRLCEQARIRRQEIAVSFAKTIALTESAPDTLSTSHRVLCSLYLLINLNAFATEGLSRDVRLG